MNFILDSNIPLYIPLLNLINKCNSNIKNHTINRHYGKFFYDIKKKKNT